MVGIFLDVNFVNTIDLSLVKSTHKLGFITVKKVSYEMFHNKIRQISLISAFLLLFLTYPSFAGQLSLRVIPETINAGDTVRIEFINQHQPIKNYAIQIIFFDDNCCPVQPLCKRS